MLTFMQTLYRLWIHLESTALHSSIIIEDMKVSKAMGVLLLNDAVSANYIGAEKDSPVFGHIWIKTKGYEYIVANELDK